MPNVFTREFYRIVPCEYGGYVITCSNWDESEWNDSEGYNYYTEEDGEVEFYWDEDANGFYVPDDYLSCAEQAVMLMNDQHEQHLFRLPEGGYWALEKTKRGYLIVGYSNTAYVQFDIHLIELSPRTYATWDNDMGGWIVSRRDFESAKEWVEYMNNE